MEDQEVVLVAVFIPELGHGRNRKRKLAIKMIQSFQAIFSIYKNTLLWSINKRGTLIYHTIREHNKTAVLTGATVPRAIE